MKKICAILVISLLFTLSMAVFTSSAYAKTLQNSEFAELLIGTLGIELPAGSEDLGKAEYFEVMVNVLAVNGIDDLVGINANTPVSPAKFTEILYKIAGGTVGASPEEMLTFLVTNYQMPSYGLKNVITFAQATEIMNNPAFAPLLAEAYSAAEALERGGAQAPGFKLEETPGTTTPTPASLT